MELTNKQTIALQAIESGKYSFIMYGGSVRGGKTVWGLSALLILCEIYPNSRWCVIRESMEKIRTTTIPSFRKLESTGVLKQSPYEYTHRNSSTILFKSENYAQDKDLDWMKGLEVNGFLFEEINECQQATFFKAFERAGAWIIKGLKEQPKPIILATCNPTFGWVKTLVYEPYKKNELNKNWCYIPAKITDNPHLPKEYLENLKNLPRYEYEVFVEGNWDIQLKVGGEFYKCFELQNNVEPTAYNPILPLHISFDDNVNPYLPVGVFQIQGSEIRMIDEITGIHPNNTVKSVCNEFIRKYPNHQSGLFIYGDATANKQDTKLENGYNFYRLILDYLKEYRPQNRVLSSNPSVAMRGNWINSIFEKQTGGVKIVIGENCKHTINDLILVKENAEGGKLKEEATDPKTKARYQTVGHFSDILDYVCVSAFANKYQEYLRGGVIKAPLTARNQSKNSY